MLSILGKWGSTRNWLSLGGLTTMAGLALLGVACTAAAATSSTPAPSPSAAADSEPAPTPTIERSVPANDLCLACHAKPGIVHVVGRTEAPLVAIEAGAFATSAHASTGCAKCHPAKSEIPHRPPATSTISAIEANELCSSCHREASEGYAHTVHGVVSNFGDRRAPGCTDCHTAHDVRKISDWTSAQRGEACARCHDGADATFAKASMGHREASATWFAPTYFAGRFLVVLLACTLAFGTLHVELDMLRWGFAKVRGRHAPEKSE